jgi:hypothetical protein
LGNRDDPQQDCDESPETLATCPYNGLSLSLESAKRFGAISLTSLSPGGTFVIVYLVFGIPCVLKCAMRKVNDQKASRKSLS